MTGLVLLAAAVALVAFGLAMFPPRKPRWWRRHTRPLRRALRPGHYR